MFAFCIFLSRNMLINVKIFGQNSSIDHFHDRCVDNSESMEQKIEIKEQY